MEARLSKEIELNQQYEILHSQLKTASEEVSSENEELARKIAELQEAYDNLEAGKNLI